LAKVSAPVLKNEETNKLMDKFLESSILKGVWIHQADNFSDSRGSVHEWFNSESNPGEFAHIQINQLLTARNVNNVIRGIHFSGKNNPQLKLVTCASGKILDVVIDFREGSDTFGLHDIFILDSNKSQTVMIPHGFGHGYQVISSEATVQYALQTQFDFQEEFVVNPFDSKLGIPWLSEKHILSDRDLSGENFDYYFDLNLRLFK
jgi:dTDP-4-dehydrorhamnose 3,5-epimerase